LETYTSLLGVDKEKLVGYWYFSQFEIEDHFYWVIFWSYCENSDQCTWKWNWFNFEC
jgi:hypothetical protein